MTTKTNNIVYWIATIIFSLLVLMDGIGGVTHQQAGQDVLKHLGYPMYLLTITGVAKILAAIALLQTKFKTIKEWAFAGIAISFIGGFASRAFAGDGAMETVFPLIMLAIMFIPYFLWKKKGWLSQPSGKIIFIS